MHTGLEQSSEGAVKIVSMADLYAEECKDLIVDFSVPVATSGDAESHVTLADCEVAYIDAMRGARKTPDAAYHVVPHGAAPRASAATPRCCGASRTH